MKKPAAGGVRQAFELIEQRLRGGVPPLYQASLGRRSGSPEPEAMWEEVHCFVEVFIHCGRVWE
jgi:hypothetical protein